MNGTSETGSKWTERLRAINLRVQAMVKEYGMVAVAMLLVLSVVNIGAFYFAIQFGFSEMDIGTGGTLAAAWVASRATKPVANVVALALTPIAARIWRGKREESL